MELIDGQHQVLGGVVGPQAIAEMELGISGLEEKEIAQPFFAACPDEKVDVFDRAVGVNGERQTLTETAGGIARRSTNSRPVMARLLLPVTIASTYG